MYILDIIIDPLINFIIKKSMCVPECVFCCLLLETYIYKK